MANVQNGNSAYVDATGEVTARPTKVIYIVFTPNAANDQLILKDDDNSGDIKLSLQSATAKTSMFFDFSANPIFFPNGVYVSTLTASATATLVGTA